MQNFVNQSVVLYFEQPWGIVSVTVTKKEENVLVVRHRKCKRFWTEAPNNRGVLVVNVVDIVYNRLLEAVGMVRVDRLIRGEHEFIPQEAELGERPRYRSHREILLSQVVHLVLER